MKKQKIQTLIFSDIHLGSKACNTEAVISILNEYEPERIILNGDIIDFELMGMQKSWSSKHNDVVRKLFKQAKKGTEIIYIIGNHDDVLREYEPLNMGNIQIINSYEYNSEKYGKILFIHGDCFDFIIRNNKWLSNIGTFLYDVLIFINHYFNKLRKLFRLSYWSLSKYLKQETKKRIGLLEKFDFLCIDYAKKHGYSGIICGHIHIPEFKEFDNFLYINCGDMCETCSYVIEDKKGNFKLLYYTF